MYKTELLLLLLFPSGMVERKRMEKFSHLVQKSSVRSFKFLLHKEIYSPIAWGSKEDIKIGSLLRKLEL